MNLIQYGPVSKEAVKEIVGNAKKPVNVDLEVGGDGHVSQFRFEAAQLRLKGFYASLSLIQTAVLCQVCHQAAAHQVPGAPAFGTVQAVYDLVCDGQRILAGGKGFFQFTALTLQIGSALFQTQDLLCNVAAVGLDGLGFLAQHSSIAGFAVLEE